ncbi:hypothetical protein IKG16_02915, partial [Candidatus Saccharibacteria bacterium]|nr:hypothetical protein [Candidatus Saccharibacteria bacterium]
KTTTKTSEESTEKKSCKKGLIIGGIIAAILIVAAIIIFAVIKPFSKNMVGKYEITGLTSSTGEDQSSYLSLMKAFGMNPEIEIIDGKTGTMSISGENIKFTYDGNKFYFEIDEEEEEDSEISRESEYTYKDDEITLKSDDNNMIFSRKSN